MLKQYHLRDFRLRLVVYVFAITILGILLVGSAEAEYQNQQILGMVLGTGAMLVLALIDYRIWMNLYWVIYAVNLVLLLAVHFFGDSSGGAKRWLDLGIRFQPSELTKLALILFFAHFFTKYREELNSWKMILISLILVGAPLFLVYEQPNLSTTLMIAMVFCILIFAGGLSYKIVGGILVVLVPSVLIFFHTDHARRANDPKRLSAGEDYGMAESGSVSGHCVPAAEFHHRGGFRTALWQRIVQYRPVIGEKRQLYNRAANRFYFCGCG